MEPVKNLQNGIKSVAVEGEAAKLQRTPNAISPNSS
jgi:hypothetical protein